MEISASYCSLSRAQDFTPRIHVAPSDFVAFTRGGKLCDRRGQLGSAEFEVAMRDQMRLYTQSQLANLDNRRSVQSEN
jgi:hypothetical protein